jgi:zinc protease
MARRPSWLPHRLVLASILFAALALSRPVAAQVFNPETFTLANGLQVVVISNHRSPIVTQMVWYKTGAADETWGKSGIAHFLEHLMFRGTRGVPPGEFSKIVARNGGRDNAFTS